LQHQKTHLHRTQYSSTQSCPIVTQRTQTIPPGEIATLLRNERLRRTTADPGAPHPTTPLETPPTNDGPEARTTTIFAAHETDAASHQDPRVQLKTAEAIHQLADAPQETDGIIPPTIVAAPGMHAPIHQEIGATSETTLIISAVLIAAEIRPQRTVPTTRVAETLPRNTTATLEQLDGQHRDVTRTTTATHQETASPETRPGTAEETDPQL